MILAPAFPGYTKARSDNDHALPRGEGDLDPVRLKEIFTPAAVRPFRVVGVHSINVG
jgi:hypothetical protein